MSKKAKGQKARFYRVVIVSRGYRRDMVLASAVKGTRDKIKYKAKKQKAKIISFNAISPSHALKLRGNRKVRKSGLRGMTIVLLSKRKRR